MGANTAMGLLWAAAADLAEQPAPTGVPSNVTENQYGNGKYFYTWTNFDPAYNTQYSYDGGSTVESTLASGVTSVDTITQRTNFAVRHASGGEYSVWVTTTEEE